MVTPFANYLQHSNLSLYLSGGTFPYGISHSCLLSSPHYQGNHCNLASGAKAVPEQGAEVLAVKEANLPDSLIGPAWLQG